MRVEDLIDAVGAIDPEYVREAEEYRGVSKARRGIRARKALLPLAACFCLLVAGSAYGLFRTGILPMGDAGMSGGAEISGEGSSPADAGHRQDGSGADGGVSGGAGAEDKAADMASGAAESAGAEPAGAADEARDAAGAEAAADAGGAESAESGQQAGERIVINEVEELQSAIYCMPAPASVRQLMPEELAGYYGVSVLPEELPDGYKADVPQGGYEIGYDESGRVLYDHIRLSYENGGNGSFQISVRTTESGIVDSFATDDLATSVIGGNEVTIGHFTEGTEADRRDGYLAIFEKQGVMFTIKSSGMEEETFLALLRSLK